MADKHEIVKVEASPMEILQAAVAQGADPEGLERLAALAERFEARQARRAFHEALAQFQEDVPQIVKTKDTRKTKGSGTNYGYTYAPLPEIERTIRPVLRANGLSTRFDQEEAEGGMIRVTCHLQHIDGHSECSHFTTPPDSGSMNAIQKRGSATSYAMRYALIQILGLTCEDDDGQGTERAPKEYERITASQAADLEALADDVGADKAGFLSWMRVSRFEDIPKAAHDKALKALAAKREQAR